MNGRTENQRYSRSCGRKTACDGIRVHDGKVSKLCVGSNFTRDNVITSLVDTFQLLPPLTTRTHCLRERCCLRPPAKLPTFDNPDLYL